MSSGAVKRKAGDAAPGASDASKKPKADASITSFFGAPKVVPKAKDTADSFKKDEWVAGLSDEQRDLLKLEIETLHESWLPYLKDEITSSGFLDLKRFLKSEEEKGTKVFPPKEDVYSWCVLLTTTTTATTTIEGTKC